METIAKSKAELTQEILELKQELMDLKASIGKDKIKKRKVLSEKEIQRIHTTLYDISLQGIVVQDQTDQVLDANSAAQKILGLSLDQLQGRTSFDPRWRATKEDGSPFPGEEHPSIRSLRTGKLIKDVIMGVYNPQDDSFKWLNICSIPVFRNNEELPYLVFTIFDDITDTKTIEHNLLESEEKFKNAFNFSPVGMAITTIDDKYFMVNKKLAEILGYEEYEIIGKTSKDFSYKDDYLLNQNKIKDVIDGKIKTFTLEKRYVHKNGNIIWAQVSLSVVKNLKGEPTYFIKQIDDITERKNISLALTRERHKLNTIIEGTGIGTWEWDINNNKLHYNERWAEIVGYDLNDIQNREYKKNDGLIHPEDVAKSNIELEKHLKGEIPFYEVEYRMLHKNGNWVWVLDRGKIFEWDSKGNPTKMFGTHQDITERKLFEYELYLAKKRAENSDRLKTAFLQNISHEIRTPLNGIIGFAELLQMEDLEIDEIKEYSSIIKKSSHRLLEIVNNILDISKIETGQLEIVNKEFSLLKLIKELSNFFGKQAAKKGLFIKLDYNENLDYKIYSDESKINQILTNFINNAIKFTDSGSITIAIKLLNDNRYEVFVKDTGRGVPLDKQSEIFQRFTQIELNTDKNFQGAGLGLAICKGLAEYLSGELKLESKVNEGAKFSLIIPQRVTEHNFDKYSFENSNSFTSYIRKYNILIVDDDSVNVLVLDRMLENAIKNANILTANNAKDALDFIQNKRIDLVFMDINMPEIDGLEASKRIKAINQNIPIIIQTAYTFDYDLIKEIKNYSEEYLLKPIEMNKLQSIIDKYLN